MKNLIDDLSKNLTPAKPLPMRNRRWLEIAGVSLAGVGLTFVLFSIRHNLNEVITTPQFLIGALILIVAWLVATYSLAILELPTSSDKKYWKISIGLIVLLGLGYLVSGARGDEFVHGFSLTGISCSLDILFLSLLPGLFALYFLKRGASTRPQLLGVILGVSCAMLAAFALQFACPSELSTHLLMWHSLVPFGVLALVGLLVGRKVLKW
jgi:hypothetical protein